MISKFPLFNPWIWKMAWRDSRTHRKRLFFFTTAIVLGISAMVSIGSFGETLNQAIDDQAKTLMGADLMLESFQPFSERTAALIDSLGGEHARETAFPSMAFFPKSGDSRLIQVRAIEGDFPFYGTIETEPLTAAETYQTGPYALVDDVLLMQFNAAPGDSIKIGARTFEILGRIKKLPNNPPVASTFNPRVYISAGYLDDMQLLGRGSLVSRRVYFKFSREQKVDEIVEAIKPHLDRERLRYDTVEKRKKNFNAVLENLYRFLSLVGFVALILGSIGVASAVHVYTKQKLSNVSILRCLGARTNETFSIYLIQVGMMALTGSFLGAGLGLFIQFFLPTVFHEFLPVEIDHFIAWGSVFTSVFVGVALAMLFALLPLLSIRNVTPLLALRSSFEEKVSLNLKSRISVFLLIVIGIGLFAYSQIRVPAFAAGFTGAVVAAFAILAGVAKLIAVSVRKFSPKSLGYVWRQGIANLYRPNNQTLVLMVAIGLGTFLITTLYLSHNTLLSKVSFAGGGDRPNLVLFDIQPDQKEGIVELVESHDLPIVQQAPMVTMRLAAINNKSVDEILRESTKDDSLEKRRDRGLLRWEYRTTYRDTLLNSEEIVAGTWQGQVAENSDVVPVSFATGPAKRLGITIGDTLLWDVQGVPLTSIITSLRKVDWQRIQANFMALFPTGALEYAPQIYIFSIKAPSTEASAKLQKAVVQQFPNVSMIDLALVLNTFDTFLSKISFVIRFMAFFSIITGLIVLTAAVITSRFQRVQESVLLRTLGASRQQISKIMIIEYILLGGLAALTGLLLSYAGSWALAYFAFDATFVPTLWPFVIVLTTVIGLTVLIGMSNSRGILDRPPLEVLRVEV